MGSCSRLPSSGSVPTRCATPSATPSTAPPSNPRPERRSRRKDDRSARLRRAGTAPYPWRRSLCCSDSRAATTVTSVSSTRWTTARSTLTRPVDGRRCLGSVDRTVGEFSGLGRRHHPFPDRFDRTLLPAVADIELPAGDLKDPTCHVAASLPSQHTSGETFSGPFGSQPSGASAS